MIVDSIILLHPITDWDLQQGVLMPRLILTKRNTCFYDLRKNYYCIEGTNRAALFTTHKKRIKSFKKRLLELELVQQALNEYPEPQTAREYLDYPKFEFQQIMFIDEKVYYKLSLRNDG